MKKQSYVKPCVACTEVGLVQVIAESKPPVIIQGAKAHDTDTSVDWFGDDNSGMGGTFQSDESSEEDVQ
jgi:hypothetical protein